MKVMSETSNYIGNGIVAVIVTYRAHHGRTHTNIKTYNTKSYALIKCLRTIKFSRGNEGCHFRAHSQDMDNRAACSIIYGIYRLGHTVEVLRAYCERTAGLQRKYFGQTAEVLRTHCGSVSGTTEEVRRARSGSTLGRLRKYLGHTAEVFRTHCGSVSGTTTEVLRARSGVSLWVSIPEGVHVPKSCRKDPESASKPEHHPGIYSEVAAES